MSEKIYVLLKEGVVPRPGVHGVWSKYQGKMRMFINAWEFQRYYHTPNAVYVKRDGVWLCATPVKDLSDNSSYHTNAIYTAPAPNTHSMWYYYKLKEVK